MTNKQCEEAEELINKVRIDLMVFFHYISGKHLTKLEKEQIKEIKENINYRFIIRGF